MSEPVSEPVSRPVGLSALQRMPRALVDVLAVAYDFLTAADLLRALTFLNITPRAARQYQIGDVSAELDELAQGGWVLEGARGYRCHPERVDEALAGLSPAQVSAVWGFVIRLTQSALPQRLGGASLRTLGASLGLLARRDVAACLALSDPGGAVETVWAHYAAPGGQRAWLTERLLELDEGLLARCPLALRAWMCAERASRWLWAAPGAGPQGGGAAALAELEGLLRAAGGAEGEGGAAGLARGARALAAALQRDYDERASAARDAARRAPPRAAGPSPEGALLLAAGEALGAALLARGAPREALALLGALDSPEGAAELSDAGGALRLLGALAHLSAGDVGAAEGAWREGERALRGALRRRVLLGGASALGRRLGALAMCALRDPQAPQALTLSAEAPHLRAALPGEEEAPALRALDALYESLNADPPAHTAALPLALEGWLSSPPSPLWDLLASTLAAWAGARLSPEQLGALEARAAGWEGLGMAGLAAALRALWPEAEPTPLGRLREPEASWHRPLRALEGLAAALLARAPERRA